MYERIYRIKIIAYSLVRSGLGPIQRSPDTTPIILGARPNQCKDVFEVLEVMQAQSCDQQSRLLYESYIRCRAV